ncbi:MAG: aminopeptidase P family protein [Anaeroplasmataceae bacterium]
MNLINKLQELLVNLQIDVYIIPTNDYHLSEYVSDHFKARAYLSGFTGSAGTLVVSKTDAKLWTDGRYFIQAEHQLQNTSISLMKMGQPGVDTIEEYLVKNFSNNTIGFDSRLIETSYALKLQEKLPNSKFESIDLISKIWDNRPDMPFSMLYRLEDIFAGETFSSKIKRVREEMKNNNATYHILASLEDQAWLYNLRADDVSNTPVFLAFTIITLDKTILFIDKSKINDEILKYLTDNNIELRDYNDIYDYASKINNEKILLDYSTVNYNIYLSIYKNNTLINAHNPTLFFKAIKNKTEIENTKIAHIRDGVAMVKAIYWLKTNIGKMPISEISFSDYLERMRSLQKGYIELSFETIAAFKEHGAMMHYSATSESDYNLEADGSFFLVDSGAHYLEGTTDITRTFALGEISKEMKLHYTTVLKSVIALADVNFLDGCSGLNLDILARGPIWKLGIDYKCGTGHGVGHVLSVHEAPNGFRWKIVAERLDSSKLKPGMITTDEPGIYLENEYGIRTENELLCVEVEDNEWGHFLGFETITVCPIDLDAIDPNILNTEERTWLNNYHKFVYNTLAPYLTKDEAKWLEENTREI